MPIRGRIAVDDGAMHALSRRGSSLLPSGIIAVDGTFDAGDCVTLADASGREFARGLVAYDSAACGKIKGLGSARIEETLGYHMGAEVIHRDDLVLLADVAEDTTTERK
jgi:glutamate 5-kinase